LTANSNLNIFIFDKVVKIIKTKNMNNNLLPGYELTKNQYHEKVTGFQKYGGIMFGITMLLMSLFFYFRVDEINGMAIFMIVVFAVIGGLGIWIGLSTNKKVINPSEKIITWVSVFSGKIIKTLSFSDIYQIKMIDITTNGVYQGRVFYYLLRANNHKMPHLGQRLSKPIVENYNQTTFEENIHKLIFNS
jgi:hypothetical protein